MNPWLLVAAGFVVYTALLWVVFRLMLVDRELIPCPRDGRIARVVFRRGPDGGRDAVEHCSLLEQDPGRPCDLACLHSAAV